MSYVTVYNCDGPTCLESREEVDEPLVDIGWFVVEFADEDETHTSHFCSPDCLGLWAKEFTSAAA